MWANARIPLCEVLMLNEVVCGRARSVLEDPDAGRTRGGG